MIMVPVPYPHSVFTWLNDIVFDGNRLGGRNAKGHVQEEAFELVGEFLVPLGLFRFPVEPIQTVDGCKLGLECF
jgi:hypothetical protein